MRAIKWCKARLVLAHRVKNEKKTHGRLQQRQWMKSNDGRDVVVPLPLLVQAGKHKDFCDPRKKIKDLLSSHGHNLTFYVMSLDLTKKPQEDGGVLLRQDICNHPKGLKQFRRGNVYHVGDRVVSDCTVKRRVKKCTTQYSSLRMNSQQKNFQQRIPIIGWKCQKVHHGRTRLQSEPEDIKSIQLQRRRPRKWKIKYGRSKTILEDEGAGDGPSNAIIAQIMHDMSQVIVDDILLGDSEGIRNAKKKIEHYVRQNYSFLCKVFEYYTFKSLCTDRDGTILVQGCAVIHMVDIVHFIVHTGLLRPTEENFAIIEKILKDMGSARLSALAREEGGEKYGYEGKSSGNESTGTNYFFTNSLSQGKFIEFLIRLTFLMHKNERSTKASSTKNKNSNASSLSYQVNHFRKVIQDVVPYFERRVNLRIRRIVSSEECKNLIESNFEQLKQVFDFYSTADANKDNTENMNRHSINFREFLLLMTDSMLIGECPGDTNEETQKQALLPFIGSQARDESQAVNALQQSEAQRSAAGIFTEITFCEFIEAVVRIALAKWDDPTIMMADKVQLAFEAISILAQ